MRKINWGVLSTANIGLQKVIPAMQASDLCNIRAIASRNLTNAEFAASKLGIEKAYGSYEELLADPEIEAIYNPLPNHLHVPLTIKAMEAGKHVLCEKPISLSTSEANQLLAATKKHTDVKVMEAFMYKFHPQWTFVKKLINDGRIGQPRTIQAFFSYFNDNPDNIRNKKEIGGGGLMDIGCYCISQSRFVFEKEPLRVQAIMDYDKNLGTDRMSSAILDFGTATAIFTCSTQLAPFQNFRVFGTAGMIDVEIPVNTPPDQQSRILLQNGGNKEEFVFEPRNQYTLQGDAFSMAIINNTEVPTPLHDAIDNMKVIEAIVESNETGEWIQV